MREHARAGAGANHARAEAGARVCEGMRGCARACEGAQGRAISHFAGQKTDPGRRLTWVHNQCAWVPKAANGHRGGRTSRIMGRVCWLSLRKIETDL